MVVGAVRLGLNDYTEIRASRGGRKYDRRIPLRSFMQLMFSRPQPTLRRCLEPVDRDLCRVSAPCLHLRREIRRKLRHYITWKEWVTGKCMSRNMRIEHFCNRNGVISGRIT